MPLSVFLFDLAKLKGKAFALPLTNHDSMYGVYTLLGGAIKTNSKQNTKKPRIQ